VDQGIYSLVAAAAARFLVTRKSRNSKTFAAGLIILV